MKIGGTGGANTNRGGLAFENSTDLSARIKKDLNNAYALQSIEIEPSVINSSSPVYSVTRKLDNKVVGILTKQFQFYNVMKNSYGLDNINHKRWKPDEVFFNFETNTIFIVEKKWQQGPGSVDEKIFGFVNKRRLYQNNFNQSIEEPKPTVEFAALFNSSWWIYGLSNPDDNTLNNVNCYPRKNEKQYQDYFDNLRIDGVKIFFDDYDYWWFGL